MAEAWKTIAKKLDDILISANKQIKSLYSDVKIGYIGSLITVVKYSIGGSFYLTDFDVDAFIVSDELVAKFDSSIFFKDASKLPEFKKIVVDLETTFKNNFSGYRVDTLKPFTFRIWTEAEYLKNVLPYGCKIFE